MTELNIAIEIAKTAGQIMLKYMGKEKDSKKKTGFSDIVTKGDMEVDNHAKSIIARNFPKHSILTEESGGAAIDSDNLWVVDPIDGTNNFSKEFPFFAFSIAYYRKGVPQMGVVYNPLRKEMFYAVKDQGAYLNDRSLEVSKITNLNNCLIISGFSHSKLTHQITLERIGRIAENSNCIRMLGSAALNLCYTAQGIADGVYEPNLKPWDYAAGALILQEAGGKVSGPRGEDFSLGLSDIIASNGKVHNELVGLLSDEA